MPEGVPELMSFRASSPEYELKALCAIAVSRAFSMLSSHSCADAEVADPSDFAELGSSKL